MSLETVAILSPGDMGHAVGRRLRERGLRVVTCLQGRSGRTRELSERAGLIDLPNLDELARQSDIILAITTSAAVPGLAAAVAEAGRRTGAAPLYAECNAIAPAHSRRLGELMTAAGVRYVDASIIGGPPRGDDSGPRFYASGEYAAELLRLRDYGLDVRDLGPELGRASGIKMCYAAMTKGTAALQTQLLLAAGRLGLWDELLAEFQASHPAVVQRMEGGLPRMPANARRWVSEMEEIRDAFEALRLTPQLFQGVAEMYRLIGATTLGDETPETWEKGRTLAQTIQQLNAQSTPAD